MTYLTLNKLSQKLGGRSRSSLYRDVKAQTLPQPICIGCRIYWLESAVDEAIDAAQVAA